MNELKYNLTGKRIWVAGHTGLVGSALCKRLNQENPSEIITVGRQSVDLTRQSQVEEWLSANRPDVIFCAAAEVGGIHANSTYPAEFIYNNLAISTSIIHGAHKCGVEKLLFLGSSCIYPKFAEQPISEDSLLTGALEPTNEWYAVAKIAGIKLCQAYRRQYGHDFISAMPTNLYGPGDSFHPENSHVIPSLIRKAVEAKSKGVHDLAIWGTGQARREFMHVDDCADGLVFIMKYYSESEHINVSTNTDLTIEEMAWMIMDIIGLKGGLNKDLSKPDGTPQKLMSNHKLATMGWTPRMSLKEGLKSTIDWYMRTQV